MKVSFVVAVYQNEVIFLDDGSTDGSLEEIRKLRASAGMRQFMHEIDAAVAK